MQLWVNGFELRMSDPHKTRSEVQRTPFSILPGAGQGGGREGRREETVGATGSPGKAAQMAGWQGEVWEHRALERAEPGGKDWVGEGLLGRSSSIGSVSPSAASHPARWSPSRQ